MSVGTATGDRLELLRMQSEIAALNVRCLLLKLMRAFAKAYHPDQPRVPAGNPDGGQWTDGISGTETLGDRTSFLPPQLIEEYNMGPVTVCVYQGWPESNRFAIHIPRGRCRPNYLPGYGSV